MPEKLRIGVMAASSGSVEGWEAYILSELSLDPNIEWTVILQHKEPMSAASALADRIKRKWRRIPAGLALRFMERVDELAGRSAYPSIGKFQVDERYPLPDLLPGVPVLHVTPNESASRLVQRFDEETIKTIREYQLDLLIRFGFKILRGKILSAARFGIVSYHHADNRVNRGGPCGFWEVYNDLGQTGSTLQVLTEELDSGTVIKRGIYPTHRFSWAGNRRRLRATSTLLMIDAIRELARERRWCPLPDPRPLSVYAHPLYVNPGFRDSLTFLGKLAGRSLKHVGSRIFSIRQWRILYQVGPAPSQGVEPPAPANLILWKFKQLVPPRGRFYADPFLCWRDGKLYLFVEDFSRATGKAVISWLEWMGKEWKYGGVALDCPYHLSYPFVFEHQGRVFMIPESYASRRVELWEAEEFPGRWKLARVLLDNVRAVDSTILAKDGSLYLFTNLDRSETHDPGTELHIYSIPDLLNGTLCPHARNPVIQDCRVARNAGGFFTDSQGRLIRAAQINSSGYGEGLVFREVKRLTSEEYEEETLETVLPQWEPGLEGMHHTHFAQGSIVMDSLHRVQRFF